MHAHTDRGQWQLGSLSHAVNSETTGYIPLPDFPTEAPDPGVREVDDDIWGMRPGSGKKTSKFYGSDDEESGSDFYSSISGTEESGSESGSEEGKLN